MDEESLTQRIGRRLVYGGIGAAGMLVVITVAAIAVATNGTGDVAPEAEPLDGDRARTICVASVHDRLELRGLADFPRLDVSPVAGGRWQVEGTVDTETDSGATLWSSFRCLVAPEGETSARLVELEITE